MLPLPLCFEPKQETKTNAAKAGSLHKDQLYNRKDEQISILKLCNRVITLHLICKGDLQQLLNEKQVLAMLVEWSKSTQRQYLSIRTMTHSLGKRTEMSSHPDWYEMIQQLTSLLLHDSTVVLLELSLEGGVGPINTSSAEKHFVKHVTIYLFQLHQEAVKTLI